MFFPVSSLPATIAAQFIEISHESVHVGDDVTLKCSLADNEHDTRDVTNYVWYLNSESHEAKKFYWFFPLCFFPSSSPIRKPAPRFVSFFFLSLPFLLCCFAFDCLPFFCRTNDDAEADKKVINGEHFVKIGNELLIRNAVKHLTGYYSCVVEFEDSGAKLETPHELINIIGEYPTSLCAICWQRMHTECAFPIKTLPFAQRAGGEKAIIDTSRAPQQTLQGVGKFH